MMEGRVRGDKGKKCGNEMEELGTTMGGAKNDEAKKCRNDRVRRSASD